MIEKMKDLLRKKESCVLATVSGGRPHCSLMSYVTDSECREIFMVTLSHTKKYQNLVENPWVSLLIDTREEGRDRSLEEKKALTIGGVYRPVDPAREKQIREHFLSRHPQLKDLVEDPQAVVISIAVRSFQLLEGVRNACFAEQD